MEQCAGGKGKKSGKTKSGGKTAAITTQKITGTYNEDYNILYLDEIIRRKLDNEKHTCLPRLKQEYLTLYNSILQPQTYGLRQYTLTKIQDLMQQITSIEDGTRMKEYISKVSTILEKYRNCTGNVRVVNFGSKPKSYNELDDDARNKIALIDEFIDIAGNYIDIDVIRVNTETSDICIACGKSIAKIAPDDNGIIRCADEDCQTEHNIYITAKLAKDNTRISSTTVVGDESFENFDKAFLEYQGLQQDPPPHSICEELDAYFISKGRPSGAKISAMPLNSRGRRYDTTPKMLWDALSSIGRSEYYKDTNYIGKIYWGWVLPNVMHLRESIKYKYIKTQKGFYAIPPEERDRNSSLGTQYRLWRHLQLENHECYPYEFKIAENPESIRIHNKLWRIMCESADDDDIYYID